MSDDNVIPFPRRQTPSDPEPMPEDTDPKPLDTPLTALAALQTFLEPLGLAGQPQRRLATLLPRRAGRACFVVRVDLDGARPPVWRRLRLASDLTLPQVHEVLQIALGWTDSHLHHFVMGPISRDWQVDPFLTRYDLDEGEEGILEDRVRLDEVIADPGDRLFYEYDFGDNWQHTLRLETIQPWTQGDPDARCVDGRRACPPEDVGGLTGYEEMLDVLTGTSDLDEDERDQILTWLPAGYDPDQFSPADVNRHLAIGLLPDLTTWHPQISDLLHRCGDSGLSPLGRLIKHATAGARNLTDDQAVAAVHPYQHLLATIGDGIKLTAAGYLPPRLVETLYTDLNLNRHWIGKGNREDQTLPVLQLRESATSLGLLRKHTGRLDVTRAGRQHRDRPRALLAHIGARLPLGQPHERDAGLLALLTAAAGSRAADDPELEPAAILHTLGWRVSGTTLQHAARGWAYPTTTVLDILNRSTTHAALRTTIARTLIARPRPNS